MIPLNIINEIWTQLDTINCNNGTRFMPRFGENHIFIDKSNNLIISYYCRIEYSEHNDYYYVQFYNYRINQFEPKGVKFNRELFKDSLEQLLISNVS